VKIAGLILAGGRSTRFGTEKSMALLAGAPLIDHVRRMLISECRSVAVSAAVGSAAQAWAAAQSIPVLNDDLDMASGSLNGIQAGLTWASDLGITHLAVLACDTPRLPPSIVDRLVRGIENAPGVVAVDTDGATHTLCSVWQVALRHRLAPYLRKDRYAPIREIQKELGFARVQFDTAFTNVNTPDDLRSLEA
jgi:molybdenum cofactor guanylyltransferase